MDLIIMDIGLTILSMGMDNNIRLGGVPRRDSGKMVQLKVTALLTILMVLNFLG